VTFGILLFFLVPLNCMMKGIPISASDVISAATIVVNEIANEKNPTSFIPYTKAKKVNMNIGIFSDRLFDITEKCHGRLIRNIEEIFSSDSSVLYFERTVLFTIRKLATVVMTLEIVNEIIVSLIVKPCK